VFDADNGHDLTRQKFAGFAVSATVFGFICGIAFSSWKVSIEPAQVIAGLIQYPPANPNYVQQIKMFTIIHQLCALALRAGASEAGLCWLMSGLQGSLVFLSVGTVILAVSRRVMLAALAPFLLVRCFEGSIEGVTYNTFLVEEVQDWGLWGLCLALLIVGLYATGRARAASFALGVSPAVHPSFSVWMFLVIGLIVLFDRRALGPELRRLAGPFLGGLALALAAMFVHFYVYPGYRPPRAFADADEFLRAELTYWDVHRAPFSLSGRGAQLVLASLALALFARLSKGPPRFVARVFLTCLAVSALFSIGNWLPAQVPGWLVVLMPSRTFNIPVLGSLALWIGLLGGGGGLVRAAMLLVALATLALPWFHPAAMVGTVAVAHFLERSAQPAAAVLQRLRTVAAGLQATVLVAGVVLVLVPRLAVIRSAPSLFPETEVVATALRKGSGMVLVGSNILFVQARTRRPILLRGESIDVYAYAPEASVEVVRILDRLYGIDALHPPQEVWRVGGLARDSGRAVWEKRTAEEWSALAHEFGFSEIVTWSDWRLGLPLSARDDELALYRVAD
jgi:hypothetical protein